MPRTGPLYIPRQECLRGRKAPARLTVPLSVALLTLLLACEAPEAYVRDLESGVLERQLAAAAWFVDHPTTSARPALVGQLRSPHPELRIACARAILAGDDRNARTEALRALRRDALSDDPGMATAAMEALIEVGGEALPELMRIALATPNRARRAVTAAIIHEGLGAADPSERAAPTQVLLSALESTDPERHRIAYAILAALVEPLADELIDQGLRHPRMLVRRSVVTAAGEQRVAAFAEPIAKMLSTPDTSLRKQAARALGEIGDPATAGYLLSLEKRETQYGVLHEAREALRKLGVERD